MIKNNNIRKLYTDKQIQAFQAFKKDFWVLIQHGAKRAGKTISNNDLFLMEVIKVRKTADRLKIPEPQYILAGNSLGTLEKNVLTELRNRYGLKFHFDKFNRIKLFGVLVCCFGHGTVKDMERIRGMTSFGAYINEATTGVEEVIREIFNRCSGEGARILMDTNPDNPEHYIKKEFIDKADGKKLIEIHYQLDDNDFLSERYKENVKATTPTGQFYDRDILGLWVNSEGVVYKDFDRNKMVLKHYKKEAITEYIAGVDWGYEHLGSIAVIGIDSMGNHCLVEEYAAQYEEIDYWVNVAKDIKNRFGNIPFYADTARPEHIARFSREGINVKNGNKSILSGVEEVAKLMKEKKFYILESCKQFLKEVYNYVWNKDKGMPEKKNDDLMDALRYAIYTHHLLTVGYKVAKETDWGNYKNDKGTQWR